MKALKFFKNRGLILEEVPVPALEDGEALIKVLACSICGSDIRVLKGEKKTKKDGVTLGHEIAGVVERSNNPKIKKGTKVTVFPSIFCRRCRACLSGRTNLCPNKLSFGNALNGGFAQYMVVPKEIVENNGLVEINLPLHIGCLVEPLSCVLNSYEALGLSKGSSLLILGAGPLGLMHLCVAKEKGIKVCIIDRNTPRLETALSIYPEATVSLSLNQIDGEFDAAVVCAFAPKETEAMLKRIRAGGVLNLFAGGNWSIKSYFTPNLVHYGERIITGTHSTKPVLFEKAARLAEKIEKDLSKIVTHRFPLERFYEAFGTYTSKKGLKVVIEPNTSP